MKTPRRQNWISWMRMAVSIVILELATMLLFAAITTQAAQAQTLTTLHEFDDTDGSNPYSGLVHATDGNFYGTTTEGGANSNSLCTGENDDAPGCGTVFKITPSGTLTTLYSFCAQTNCADGGGPTATLIQAANGNLYGTTFFGGTGSCVVGGTNYGCGTVFEITLAGKLTTLHSFVGTDGQTPEGGLVQSPSGNFFGATSSGGSTGSGTIFKMTANGTLTTLYNFCGYICVDNGSPKGALVLASNGYFYGTTSENVSGDTVSDGTVFKISSTGAVTTLHTFTGTDGSTPFDTLVQGTDGNLYGTTLQGGTSTACSFGCGTVFKMTPTGTLTSLHSFDSTDGNTPYAGLVQGSDGNFYGTTNGGGADGNGTIFEITPGGTLTTLHSFGNTDGDEPFGGLVQGTDGNFYGTTEFGGSHNGTVFSLSTGLAPFVQLQATSGKEGVIVGMLGQGFSSSSVVKFGGTQATTLTRTGTTFIKATVPAGALTGAVTVITGATTLTSSQTFKVTPTFTSFAPPSGPVGTPVTITGTGLKQATKVTFNGKSAAITVNSDTEITATVPTGATTGKISVTTRGGSATNATSFTVE